MILAQAGVEWEEMIYEQGDAPHFKNNPQWVKDKEDGLGMDFPNVSMTKLLRCTANDTVEDFRFLFFFFVFLAPVLH
jgi:hypothetical protein